MKRTPPRPSTKPIARHTRPPRSTKPIRARKTDPSKRRFAKHRCQPFLDWLKTEACCITLMYTGQWIWGSWSGIEIMVDPAHIRPRSLGSDDLYNAVPLARHLHSEQEGRTKAFERKYGVDLKAIARECTEKFLAEFPEFRGAPPDA